MSRLHGLLTALKNTAIPMTVIGEYEEDQIEVVYTENGKVQRLVAPSDAFVGFGDSLIFTNGAFVDAYISDESDDDEDDDEDEDDDDEEDDKVPADHDALKN